LSVGLVTAASTATAATTTTAAITTAAAATAAASTTATAATTTATIFAWAGFVDSQGTAIVLLEVQAFNGGLRFGIGAHLDKAEAFAAARVAIHDDFRALNAAELGEELLQIRT